MPCSPERYKYSRYRGISPGADDRASSRSPIWVIWGHLLRGAGDQQADHLPANRAASPAVTTAAARATRRTHFMPARILARSPDAVVLGRVSGKRPVQGPSHQLHQVEVLHGGGSARHENGPIAVDHPLHEQPADGDDAVAEAQRRPQAQQLPGPGPGPAAGPAGTGAPPQWRRASTGRRKKLNSWAVTVAAATPATPQWNNATNTTSRRTLRTLARITATKGVRLLPRAESSLPATL